MREELEERAAQTVSLARAAGADEVWATAGRTREVGFTVRNGELEEVTESTSRSVSVRLFVDGRYSTHATTDLRPERLEGFLREAVALTRALEPDAYRTMPDAERFGDPTRTEALLGELDLEDPGLAALDREPRLAWCRAMNERVHGQPGVISVTSSAGDTASAVAAASSNGFRGSYATTSLGLSSEVTLDDGEKRPEEVHWASARHVEDLPEPAALGDEALRLARARLGAEKGETRRTTMVVAPRSAGQLLGRLLGPAQGALVQQDQSFWKARLGTRAVASVLSVVDDPLRPRGLASRPFDREGFAAERLPLIEAGTLSNLYVDTYYGRKLDRPPTTGSPSNRVVEPGTRDLGALLRAAGEGVYVNAWLGGNVDSSTGDFSFGIRGHRIEGGTLGPAVAELNVTGNLVDLFQHLVEVGSDPWLSSSILAPTLLFEDVQFGGI